MNQTKQNSECQVKTEEGLLTRNAEHLTSQVWDMENTVSLIEQFVNKLRSPVQEDKLSEGKCVEPVSVYEKYTHIKDRMEVLNKRLTSISQELGEIV